MSNKNENMIFPMENGKFVQRCGLVPQHMHSAHTEAPEYCAWMCVSNNLLASELCVVGRWCDKIYEQFFKWKPHTHRHPFASHAHIFAHQTERLLDWQTTLYRQCSLRPISVVTIAADGNCVGARQRYFHYSSDPHKHTHTRDTQTFTRIHARGQWNLTSERKKRKNTKRM